MDHSTAPSSQPNILVKPYDTYRTYNVSVQEALNAEPKGGQDLPWFLHPQWQAMAPLEEWLMTSIGVLMSLVGTVGAVGNFIVLFMLLRCKKLQTSANMYVLNLAAADLLMCLGNFPILILSSFSGRWVSGYSGCKIYGFVGGLAGFVSINTLTVMACDRYNKVYHPKGLVKAESRRYSMGLMVSLWIYSGFWAIPPFFGWGHFALDGGQISCCFDYLTRRASDLSYIVAIFVFCFGIQVIVILFCYVGIVIAIYRYEQNVKRAQPDILMYHDKNHSLQRQPKHQRQQNHNLHMHNDHAAHLTEEERNALGENAEQVHESSGKTKTRSQRRRKMEMRVTWLVVFITLSFCMSWIPFAVVALIGSFGDASKVTPLISVLPGIFAKIATVANPLLYAMGHPHYRSVIVKRFRKTISRKRSNAKMRGKESSSFPRQGAMLSSVYFASVFKDSENRSASVVELAV